MNLGVLGLTHRTAPIEIRERFHVERGRLEAAVAAALEEPALRECVVLSTCNRIEYYFAGRGAEVAERHLLATMARQAGLPADEVRRHVFRHIELDSAVHLFRVVSGLDSLVVGEHQIQGQVGDAYRLGRRLSEGVGPVLHRLFQSALSAGGRVRTETRIAEGAASVPSAAVDLSRKVLGSLGGRRVMVVGTGEMGRLTLTCLMDEGLKHVLVASRSLERARRLAARSEVEAIPHELFWERLPEVDLLVTSTSADRPFITADRIRRARPADRPLVILDIAVPRNVEAAAGDLQGVFLYNIDDLQRVVEAAQEARQEELPIAEAIVREEAERFWSWYRARRAAPVIRRMRERAERIRRQEIEAALDTLGVLSEEERERIHMASRAALNKILHVPTAALRQMAQEGEGLEAVRRLFEVDREDDDVDGRGGGANG